MIRLAFITALTLLAAAPLAAADPSPPSAVAEIKDARLVPTLKDGTFIGLKVYAIRAGGRFDQPSGPFKNGDVIVAVDLAPVSTDDGQRALVDKVVLGKADAVVTVLRAGATVSLKSAAIR